jgi:hypothetical protein
LRGECGHLHAENRYERFGGVLYCQRLELKQPSRRAFELIAPLQGHRINFVEATLDCFFNCFTDREDAFDYVDWHWVQRWHGKTQKVKLVGRNSNQKQKYKAVPGRLRNAKTRYGGSRAAANKPVMYEERFGRIEQEPNCLHLEWHLNGRLAVERAGIKTAQDLLEFNHQAFWKKRLLFQTIDPDKLGRLVSNQSTGQNRRKIYDLDRRHGHILINSVRCLQDLIDEYGSKFRLDRVLQTISNEQWLPSVVGDVRSSYTGNYRLATTEGNHSLVGVYYTK